MPHVAVVVEWMPIRIAMIVETVAQQNSHNITVSMPTDLIEKVKRTSIFKGTSILNDRRIVHELILILNFHQTIQRFTQKVS